MRPAPGPARYCASVLCWHPPSPRPRLPTAGGCAALTCRPATSAPPSRNARLTSNSALPLRPLTFSGNEATTAFQHSGGHAGGHHRRHAAARVGGLRSDRAPERVASTPGVNPDVSLHGLPVGADTVREQLQEILQQQPNGGPRWTEERPGGVSRPRHVTESSAHPRREFRQCVISR